MTREEAMQHALGYAAGREDASGIRTADGNTPPDRGGFIWFAEAFASAQDDYNAGRYHMMTNARSAYESWQRTNGESIL